jgi:hypothetical protein
MSNDLKKRLTEGLADRYAVEAELDRGGIGIGNSRALRTPQAVGEMETRRTGLVRNGRWGGFLGVGRGGLEIPGAPPVGPEGPRGQASQL